jgi:hypothetical protein
MFCNQKVFSNYVASHGGETVSVGDKCTLVVEGRESITFKIQLSSGFRTIVLHGALHVPWLATNLVSLGAFQREGSSFCSCEGEDGLVITQGGDKLFQATLNDSLYYINCASDGINEMALTILSGNLWLWHRRMGHLHLEAICKMAQKNMVNGDDPNTKQTSEYIQSMCNAR